MLFVLTPEVPRQLAAAVERCGAVWKHICALSELDTHRPPGNWEAGVILQNDPASTVEICRDSSTFPVLVVAEPDWLDHFPNDLPMADCITSLSEEELVWRLRRILRTTSEPPRRSFAGIELDDDSYQARAGARVLDLTYMEYELLGHFVDHPGKVHSRQELLRDVWKYDNYYGGARTVDVHVRRLRSKLGGEHAELIQTVRSVGYCLGELR